MTVSVAFIVKALCAVGARIWLHVLEFNSIKLEEYFRRSLNLHFYHNFAEKITLRRSIHQVFGHGVEQKPLVGSEPPVTLRAEI